MDRARWRCDSARQFRIANQSQIRYVLRLTNSCVQGIGDRHAPMERTCSPRWGRDELCGVDRRSLGAAGACSRDALLHAQILLSGLAAGPSRNALPLHNPVRSCTGLQRLIGDAWQ